MIQVEITPRAAEHIHRISVWWRAHRREVPLAFDREMGDALDRMAEMPESGTSYGERNGVSLRCVRLPRTECDLYSSYDAAAETIYIRAVWPPSAMRLTF